MAIAARLGQRFGFKRESDKGMLHRSVLTRCCLAFVMGASLVEGAGVSCPNEGGTKRPATDASAPDHRAFLDLSFQRDFVPGRDRNGKVMGGTECNYIIVHDGKLFASLSCWKHDRTMAPLLGAQVLVKRAANAEWELDVGFGREYGTSKIIRSVSFTTDRHGRKLSVPKSVLLADATRWAPPYDVGVWTRNDQTEQWTRTVISEAAANRSSYSKAFSTEIRILVDHVDKVTGVHCIFACTNQGKIHRGAYDPDVPGQIFWYPQPELDERLRRTSSGWNVNGELHVSIGMDARDPNNGGIFRRVDGPAPRWVRVAGWEHQERHRRRGQTSELRFAPVTGADGQVLLATQAHPVNTISRIEVQDHVRTTVELDVQSFVADRFPGARVISFASNGFAPFRHPDSGEEVQMGGLWLYLGEQTVNADARAAWYLVRYGAGEYGLGRILDPAHPEPNPNARGGLRDARTICASPFAVDRGRVFYFGGFNCGTHFLEEKLVDTAWIYKATLPVRDGKRDTVEKTKRVHGLTN